MRLKLRSVLLFLPFILSILLLVASLLSAPVGSFAAQYIAPVVRRLLAAISSRFGFSLFEICVLLFPIILCFIVRYVIKGCEGYGKRIVNAIAAVSAVCSIYVITILIPSLAGGRGEIPMVAEEELYSAAEILISEISSLDGELCVPRAIYEIFDDAKRICSEKSHGWLPVAKPLISSNLFSRLGILGLYSFPTAEININVKAPQYMIPFSVLHEYSHYVGIIDEGKANFFAFSLGYNSNKAYIRYSASLSALEYILLDLHELNLEKYITVYNMLSERAKSDLDEYREFLNESSGSPAYSASEKLHETLSASQSYSSLSRYVTRYLLPA